MSKLKFQKSPLWAIERKDLQDLFDALMQKQYRIMGPILDGAAIIYDEINSVQELPLGLIDHQDGGTYRLEKTDSPTLFSYVLGPHSWKKYLFPPDKKLFDLKRHGHSFQVMSDNEKPPKRAIIGARPCELSALEILDAILLKGPYGDTYYKDARGKVFVVAVNCVRAGGTCFCVSMNTGPKAESGFDLALTEVLQDGHHYFLVEEGSKEGKEILGHVHKVKATREMINAAETALQDAAENMGRSIETKDIKELLYRNFENPYWEKIAERCLSCGNCTMVCPTCFCVDVKDYTDLSGENAQRYRRWDSCFTLDHSYIYGGSIRTSAAARYRQWITHKLGYWVEQFGMSGCVGCGRCITWCPVGIDITREAASIRQSSRIRVTESDEAVANGES